MRRETAVGIKQDSWYQTSDNNTKQATNTKRIRREVELRGSLTKKLSKEHENVYVERESDQLPTPFQDRA